MRWQLIVGIAVVLLPLARLAGQTQGIQEKLTAKLAELKTLQGTWVVESAKLKGKPLSALADMNLKIVNEQLFWVPKDGTEKESQPGIPFEIDPQKNPKRITLKAWASQKSKKGEEKIADPIQTVYQLDGDTLKLAMPGPGFPRKAVTSFQDEAAALMIFKRARPKQ